MKVFMLGWEFPPYISGGVGAACQGLTQALLDVGTDVLFMLPRPVAVQARPRVRVVRQTLPAVQPPPPLMPMHSNGSAQNGGGRTGRKQGAADTGGGAGGGAGDAGWGKNKAPQSSGPTGFPQVAGFPYVPPGKTLEKIRLRTVDAMLWPYLTPEMYQEILQERQELVDMGVTPPPDPPPAHAATPVETPSTAAPPTPAPHQPAGPPAPPPPPAPPVMQHEFIEEVIEEYAPSLLEETHRYSRIALAVAAKETFDIVHAHDWMTFEAARAVADAAGVPLVVQIHSTEYDRVPYSPDPMIVGTERAGMQAADAVIAVSQRVRNMLVEQYGIEAEKIEVIYNAVDATDDVPAPGKLPTSTPRGKLVLFLGRITSQKGPEHFLASAAKVLAVYADVTFVLAGEGDQRLAMEQLAEELGIAQRVMFTGFLSKPEVETLFQTADVYVMPSVSEPFGIVSLEALRNDVPVIISRQSGVAELLHHVLKVDFWDTDDLANKILAVLRHPPLAATLKEEGQYEVRQLTWHDAARQTVSLYERIVSQGEEDEEGETATTQKRN